jgi:hypothetical protein
VCGEARLDRRFAPNDGETFDVVAGVVQPYRENLRQAKALLDASVVKPPPPKPSELVWPIRSRPEKAPQRAPIGSMTESRREALMAERKARDDARREARADPAEVDNVGH